MNARRTKRETRMFDRVLVRHARFLRDNDNTRGSGVKIWQLTLLAAERVASHLIASRFVPVARRRPSARDAQITVLHIDVEHRRDLFPRKLSVSSIVTRARRDN